MAPVAPVKFGWGKPKRPPGSPAIEKGETETASKIRQHRRDTWITRPKRVDKHRNSRTGSAAPMCRLRLEHAITEHRLAIVGEMGNLQLIQLVRSNSRASTDLYVRAPVGPV